MANKTARPEPFDGLRLLNTEKPTNLVSVGSSSCGQTTAAKSWLRNFMLGDERAIACVVDIASEYEDAVGGMGFEVRPLTDARPPPRRVIYVGQRRAAAEAAAARPAAERLAAAFDMMKTADPAVPKILLVDTATYMDGFPDMFAGMAAEAASHNMTMVLVFNRIGEMGRRYAELCGVRVVFRCIEGLPEPILAALRLSTPDINRVLDGLKRHTALVAVGDYEDVVEFTKPSL